MGNSSKLQKVHYDHTVRDSDASIVQFLYGEDGIDVTKSATSSAFSKVVIDAFERKLLHHQAQSPTTTCSVFQLGQSLPNGYATELN